jgi:hypothetical protein
MRPGTCPTGPADGRGPRGRGLGLSEGGGSGGGAGPPRRRLGGEPERREEPVHGAGLRHRTEDPPRAAAALRDQDLDCEHPAQEPRPGPASWGWGNPSILLTRRHGTARHSQLPKLDVADSIPIAPL